MVRRPEPAGAALGRRQRERPSRQTHERDHEDRREGLKKATSKVDKTARSRQGVKIGWGFRRRPSQQLGSDRQDMAWPSGGSPGTSPGTARRAAAVAPHQKDSEFAGLIGSMVIGGGNARAAIRRRAILENGAVDPSGDARSQEARQEAQRINVPDDDRVRPEATTASATTLQPKHRMIATVSAESPPSTRDGHHGVIRRRPADTGRCYRATANQKRPADCRSDQLAGADEFRVTIRRSSRR